jgi:CDP-diglyceride synthetase/rubredoxin
MKQLLRCKVCGYVTTEDKLGTVCPACGAPRSAFEPYQDPVSARRRRLLDLNLHPMFVHFPQAFATLVLALTITPLIFSGKLEALFVSALKVLSPALVLAVIPSILTGFIDGKTRFKRVWRSLILQKKIILAALFLVSSVSLALLVLTQELSRRQNLLIAIGLALVAFGCSFFLGLLGSKLLCLVMPGD